MGGEGTITGMIISLRNNELLRRRKMVFKKDRSFFDRSTGSLGAANKPIKIRHLSEEERAYYREKTRALNRSRFLRTLLTFIALISFLGAITYLLLQ